MSMTATPGTQTFTVCESVAVSSTTAIDSQTVLTMKWKAQLSQRHTIRRKQELQQRCAQLEQDNARLRAEKQELKEKITVLNEDFKDNDEKVRFYIGLTNWNLLLIVIQFVQPWISENTIRIIDCFEIFVDRPSALLARAQTYLWRHNSKYCRFCSFTFSQRIEEVSLFCIRWCANLWCFS